MNAQRKGRTIGVFSETKGPDKAGAPPRNTGLGEDYWVAICGRSLPVKNTEKGVRAVVKDNPIEPEKVEVYLERSFGESLAAVREAMEALAASLSPDALRAEAYGLYERFRPEIARGKGGWGQKGKLDLELIRALR